MRINVLIGWCQSIPLLGCKRLSFWGKQHVQKDFRFILLRYRRVVFQRLWHLRRWFLVGYLRSFLISLEIIFSLIGSTFIKISRKLLKIHIWTKFLWRKIDLGFLNTFCHLFFLIFCLQNISFLSYF